MTTPDSSREAFYAWLRTHEDEVGALDDPSALAGWQAAMAHKAAEGGGPKPPAELSQTRMDAQPTAGPNNGWQPIETAPKDGTWMMLWRTPEEEGSPMQSEPLIFGRWYEPYESFVWPEDPHDLFSPWGLAAANKAVENDDGFGMYESNHFKYWAPLPPDPKQEGST